jgi:hypothetical protein
MEPVPPVDACERPRDDLAALALGALTGHDRSRVLAHLEGCPSCVAELEELSAAADSLSTLVPERDPPEGFSERTMALIRAEGGAPRRSVLWSVGAVAAVVILLAAAVGLGAALSTHGSHAPTSAVQSSAFHSTSGAEGTALLVSKGDKSWLAMTIHDTPGVSAVTCAVAVADGTHRQVGAFTLSAGYGSWTVTLPVAASSVRWVNVSDGRGTVIASARFG